MEDVKVGVSKDLNGGDDSQSTTFHAATKHMSLDWTHKLSGGLAGRQLKTSVDQKSQQVSERAVSKFSASLNSCTTDPTEGALDVGVRSMPGRQQHQSSYRSSGVLLFTNKRTDTRIINRMHRWT